MFVMLVRGFPDQAKKCVLNSCLIVWAQSHWKKGFSRDDINGMFKVLHDQFVNISHSEMKSFTGSH
jgi:hypothetical protein